MSVSLEPVVRVVAHTQFIAVPPELLKNGILDTQDKGGSLARLSECAGRTCYDSYGKGRDSACYHQHILEVAHGSVLEHASISFYLGNISRGCTHELVRHRAGIAISQRSTRYVEESESLWAWHPLIQEAIEWDGDRSFTGGAINTVETLARGAYDAICTVVQRYLEAKGTDKLNARKQARGAARGALGNALVTSLIWTANIRALRHTIEMRASEYADAEIRVLFNKIWERAVIVCPEFFSDYEKVECPDGIGYALHTKWRKV